MFSKNEFLTHLYILINLILSLQNNYVFNLSFCNFFLSNLLNQLYTWLNIILKMTINSMNISITRKIHYKKNIIFFLKNLTAEPWKKILLTTNFKLHRQNHEKKLFLNTIKYNSWFNQFIIKYTWSQEIFLEESRLWILFWEGIKLKFYKFCP